MKKINKIKLLILSAIISFAACDTVDFGDTNVNPNAPSNAVPSLLLTSVQRGMSAYIANTTSNLYVQYLSNGQYDEESRYETLNWSSDDAYAQLQDIAEIIKINTNDETKVSAQAYGSNGNQIAAATILKVWYFQLMTERWGYLPYSEANDAANFLKPKYDSQEDIYMGLFAELDMALGMINSGNGPDGDILFGGDMTKWRTFANTIKMVMGLRLSKADPTTGRAKFNEARTGAISSNAQNIQYTYLTEDTNDNPWQDRFESRKDYLLSDVFVNVLIGSGTNVAPEDPRLAKFAEPATTSSTFVGAPYGKSNSATANYSFITDNIIFTGDAPLMIYTYAEVLFARAEAAAKGWTTENAASLYGQAITASMQQWGVSAGDITTYVTANPYSGISDIAYEKWVSLYLQGYNSWAEWRRFKAEGTNSKIPLVIAADLLSNATGIPQRHAYSATAKGNNEVNYNAAISAQGADELDTKLWLFK
ncbi:SusD/RagB family nutrient-binding outer membrane lipoprotein [Polaribacter sp. BAL334]|uniref:SusD/RagB family nutrient-binding outer membrane lipoprotein n=1 Tax=Polaribacter sp. BAL334 TaxID=1708178 RepID=UPI0018D26494|nr:SusD/RagB family nutrient-binding outer membrane lipoprotein [Polaribacter sp. BAL334]MBG7613548.1 SusD/RagB family nutrient-binding outer membrane lipoprotein [Polaribacter sp. BAL334]